MTKPGLQAATPERRHFLLVVALVNCAFFAIDLQFAWPSPALVSAGRLLLSVILFGGAVLLRRLESPAALQVAIRGLTAGAAAAFVALAWGAGGSAGPYLAFLPLLALVVTVVVPDDPVATAAAAAICAAGGMSRLAVEGARPAQLALWAAAYCSAGIYAVAGSLLHLRSLRREEERREEGEADAARRLESHEREARAAFEQELQHKQLEALHQFANDILLLVTPEGAIRQVNDRALEAYGYTEAEMLRLNVRDLRAPEDAHEVDELLQRLVAQGSWRFTTRHRRRDGALFPAAVSSRLLQIGSTVFLQSIIRDLSAEQAAKDAGAAAEEALQKSQSQLLHAQKMEAVGRLASGVAHDFNNLLVVILGNSRYLYEQLPTDKGLREDAAQILEAAERAALLVKQLLAFSRKTVARPTTVTLEGVVRGIEKLMRRTLGEDVAVQVQHEPGGWNTQIDPGQLEQVLMNLGVNSRDAMPGGGTLWIRTGNRTVEHAPADLPGLAVGRWVTLEVRDSGQGMDGETLARAFEPFFTTKERGKGTGLGLSTVFGIVEQAGGQVTAASQPGQGATFTVWLPVCEPAVATVVAEHERRQRGRGEAVLVVEDDPSVRQSARRMLERSGFSVSVAAGGHEALALLRCGQRVDLVVSDVVMPGLSGADLRTELARGWPGLPVVLMSGYEGRAGLEDVPVLPKPFTEQALVEQVLASLGHPGRASPAVP